MDSALLEGVKLDKFVALPSDFEIMVLAIRIMSPSIKSMFFSTWEGMLSPGPISGIPSTVKSSIGVYGAAEA